MTTYRYLHDVELEIHFDWEYGEDRGGAYVQVYFPSVDDAGAFEHAWSVWIRNSLEEWYRPGPVEERILDEITEREECLNG